MSSSPPRDPGGRARPEAVTLVEPAFEVCTTLVCPVQHCDTGGARRAPRLAVGGTCSCRAGPNGGIPRYPACYSSPLFRAWAWGYEKLEGHRPGFEGTIRPRIRRRVAHPCESIWRR